MAARTARTLILAGAGAGLLTAAAALAYRVTAGENRRSPYLDRLPTPERDPFRPYAAPERSHSAQDSTQQTPTTAPPAPVRPTERPLIPTQRKRT